MAGQYMSPRTAADVKCYFCGHISGQIIARKHEPPRISDFVPRPGYAGEMPQAGRRMRCERCHGPVFLEDAGPAAVPAEDDALMRRLARKAKKAA